MTERNLSPERREALNERAAAVVAVNIYRERKRRQHEQERGRDISAESESPRDMEPASLSPVAELDLTAQQRQALNERIDALVAASIYRDLQRARESAGPSGYPGTIVGNCSSSSCREQ